MAGRKKKYNMPIEILVAIQLLRINLLTMKVVFKSVNFNESPVIRHPCK